MKRATLTLAAFFTALSLHAQETSAQKVQAKLTANDFWETVGVKINPAWNADELKALDDISKTSTAPFLRLRANKMLVDNAKNGRFAEGQEEVVAGGFKYLEAQMAKAAVHQMCVEVGFSHYVVSRQRNGNILFLIERVGQDFSGGVNLGWDSAKKEVSSFAQWGGIDKKDK